MKYFQKTIKIFNYHIQSPDKNLSGTKEAQQKLILYNEDSWSDPVTLSWMQLPYTSCEWTISED